MGTCDSLQLKHVEVGIGRQSQNQSFQEVGVDNFPHCHLQVSPREPRSQGPSGMEPTFHTTARQVSLMSLVFLKKPNSSVSESLVPGPFRTHWFSCSQGIPTEVCVLGNQMEAMFTHFFCSCGRKAPLFQALPVPTSYVQLPSDLQTSLGLSWSQV